MSGNAPSSHVLEALKLTADAVCDLFEMTITDLLGNQTLICWRNGPAVTWQDKTYDDLPCRWGGEKANADLQGVPRPELAILINPGGIFNSFAFAGLLEGSQLARKRVLGAHLAANVPLSDNTYWRVSMIKQLTTNGGISFEMRTLSDVPNQSIPARQYNPPEFPFVSTGT